jgi:hypothetical protein
MHVGLRIVLDAPVDAVRRALRSPQVMVAVTEPLLVYSSRAPQGFPPEWRADEPHPIRADLFGLLPGGDTFVDIDLYEVDGVPVQRDNGAGRVDERATGLFGLMEMRHRMAATQLADGRTLLRDRLTYRMRPAVLGALLWPGLWVTWQWRAARMRALAPSWH